MFTPPPVDESKGSINSNLWGKGMAFKEDWIRLQQNLVGAIVDETFPSGREGGEDFRSYLRRYEETLPEEWSEASPVDIIARARRARAIIVGDYHTNPYSSNMILWLLEHLNRLGRRTLVFLEALPNGFQKEIDAYTDAAIDESAFLSAVGYHASFGFDWSLYRPILDVAAQSNTRLFGINVRSHTATLMVRDRFAASVVAGELDRAAADSRSSDAVALILMGEKHLAPPHLADALECALREKGRGGPVIHIHCNVPSLYFNFLSTGYRGTPAAFKDRSGRFCLLEVSPLTLTAGDLVWFHKEHSSWLAPDFGQTGSRAPDSGDDDCTACFDDCNASVDDCDVSVDDCDVSVDDCDTSVDEAGLFGKVVTELARFFKCHARKLEDFHIYRGDDFHFIERFRRDGMNAATIHSLLEEAQRTECLYVPEYNLAWIKEVTPAHLGRTAALHLAALGLKNSSGTPRLALLNRALGALGAALLDPYIAHESLVPRLHPALRLPVRQRFTAADGRDREGFEIGLKLFRALVEGIVSFDAVRALHNRPAEACDILDSLMPKLKLLP